MRIIINYKFELDDGQLIRSYTNFETKQWCMEDKSKFCGDHCPCFIINDRDFKMDCNYKKVLNREWKFD